MKTKTFILLSLLICNLLPGPKRQAGYQTPLPRSTGRLIIRINGHISRNRGHEPEKRRHTDPPF